MRTHLLALALAALCAGPLATAADGQEREPRDRRVPPDSMPRDTVPQDTGIVAPVPVAPRGQGEGLFSIEVAIGLPGGGDAQRQPATARLLDTEGVVLDSAVLTRTLSIRGGVYGGVGGVFRLDRDWAVRLGVGVATARVETAYQGEAADSFMVRAANDIPGTRADLTLLTLETGLRYRVPSNRRLQPYLELGAAWSQWSGRGTLPTALQDDFGARFEATAGAGGVIRLTDRLSARVQASTRVFRTPVAQRTVGDTLGNRLAPGWPPTRKEAYRRTVLEAGTPIRSPFADGALEVLSLLRLQVGVAWALRAPRTAESRAEPAEATPPSGG